MAQGMEVIERVLGRIPGGIALDVATGAGNFAAAIDQCCEDCTGIIAVDAFMPPLEAVRGKLAGNIVPAAMDAERLAFPDNTFSGATISNSLHHMKDPSAVLSEMLRVLKPGGILIVREMFKGGDQTASQQTHNIMHSWWGAVDSSCGVFHNSVYSRRELEELTSACGVEKLEFETCEDISGDPFDEQIAEHIRTAWKSYMNKASGNALLEEQGHAALMQFEKYGFSGARALVAFGLKPSF